MTCSNIYMIGVLKLQYIIRYQYQIRRFIRINITVIQYLTRFVEPIWCSMKIEFPRSELADVGDGWTMVYGRRKVGKTYMLKRFVDWDVYFLIGLEGSVWIEGMDVDRL